MVARWMSEECIQISKFSGQTSLLEFYRKQSKLFIFCQRLELIGAALKGREISSQEGREGRLAGPNRERICGRHPLLTEFLKVLLCLSVWLRFFTLTLPYSKRKSLLDWKCNLVLKAVNYLKGHFLFHLSPFWCPLYCYSGFCLFSSLNPAPVVLSLK